jgi:hypothetical protein
LIFEKFSKKKYDCIRILNINIANEYSILWSISSTENC